MNKQKGLTPILIVLLIALGIGGYLIYTNYSHNRKQDNKEPIMCGDADSCPANYICDHEKSDPNLAGWCVKK